MATFVCTQCGARIEADGANKIGRCPVCEAIFILPNQLDKKENIYRLAGEALAARNYDVAETYYSRILKVDAMETQAHWGYLLSKFGIEISQDTRTLGQVIFHRLEHGSFTADPSYEKMLTYCPAEARYYYEGLSRRIEAQHNKMLAISRDMSDYDVYIDCVDESVPEDYLIASQAGKALDAAGYRVFLPCTMLQRVSQEDRNLYEMAAAEKSEVMLVVMSPKTDRENARYQAVWKRFVAWRRNDASRMLLSLYRGMRPEELPLELQALQSMECGGNDFTQRVVREINRAFGRQEQDIDVTRNILVALRDGQECLEKRDWKGAASAFRAALQLSPEEGRAHWGLVCAATQNLTAPVFRDDVDKDYELALKFSPDGQKQNYRSAMTALMGEASWSKLLSVTGNFKLEYEKIDEDADEAIQRVYLYLPADDKRLPQIETYRSKARMRGELDELNNAYNRRDAAIQPLFTRQTQEENAYEQIDASLSSEGWDFRRITNSRKSHWWALWFALASMTLLLYSARGVGFRGTTTPLFLTDILAGAGFACLLWGLAWDLALMPPVMRLLTSNAGCYGLIVACGLPLIFKFLFRRSYANIRYRFIVSILVIAALLIVLGVVAAIVLTRNVERSRKRLQEAEQRVRDADEALSKDYLVRARKIYERYGETPEVIPGRIICHSKSFEWVEAPAPSPKPVRILAKAALCCVVTIAVTTIASNCLYTLRWRNIVDVAPGSFHVLGLRENGSVVSAGNVKANWKHITQIVSGHDFGAGLREDGTVAVTAPEGSHIWAAQKWTDIVQLDASLYTLAGLKRDGTVVVATERDASYDLSIFSGIEKIHVADDLMETKKDGIYGIDGSGKATLCTAKGDESLEGLKKYLQEWTGSGEGRQAVTDICGEFNINMLHFADGDWLGAGNDYYRNLSQGNEMDFSGVTDVFCGEFTVGVKEDGTAIFAGNQPVAEAEVRTWQNLTAVEGFRSHVLGLHADGTVSAAGNNSDGECDTEKWRSVETLRCFLSTSYGIRKNGTVVSTGLDILGMTYTQPKSPLGLLRFWMNSNSWYG